MSTRVIVRGDPFPDRPFFHYLKDVILKAGLTLEFRHSETTNAEEYEFDPAVLADATIKFWKTEGIEHLKVMYASGKNGEESPTHGLDSYLECVYIDVGDETVARIEQETIGEERVIRTEGLVGEVLIDKDMNPKPYLDNLVRQYSDRVYS